jgi:energy-coupling factor transporter ATP-binding protein EcfA2
VDFYTKQIKELKDGTLQIRPDWKVGRSNDLMTRGGSFYAIWDEQKGLWSTDIYDVQRLVDADLNRFAKEQQAKTGMIYQVATLRSNGTKLWDEFQRYMRNSGNNFHNLDEKLVFDNTDIKKEDYASKRLPYALAVGSYASWDTLIGTLYSEEERKKIEWAIGAVVHGDSKYIQKFLVFYGPPGSGKSTILNVIERLFQGYTAVFDARELAGNNNAFATSAFKSNPLVAIQHDGDLSRIYDNTKLNSIVAHETMTVNEKYKAPFEAKSNAFLFMGTNVPVKISDAKSGIIRRLIDVVPTQQTLDHDTYHQMMNRIEFELGAIAWHCLQRYISMGKNYYSNYRPTEMMLQTDVFYNFVESCFDIFKQQDGVSLKQAWELYKQYCDETGIDKVLPQYKLREELKNYFYAFEERTKIDDIWVRSYYRGFKHMMHVPTAAMPIKTEGDYEIVLKEQKSIFDEQCATFPAQYANDDGDPYKKWVNVVTTLAELDTSKLHWVKVPENHIVVDFDLKNEQGEKDLALNIEAAKLWPPTYTETSQGGQGLHLHYIYTGDVKELKSQFAEGIEVKTLLGDASLRRKLSVCNDMNITLIESGLPKKEKPLISTKTMSSEKGLRDLIARNLRKEIHPGTKSSIDFIYKILDDAYKSDIPYDVRDMRSNILTFAAKSTNHSEYCVKMVQKMQFVSEQAMPEHDGDDAPLVFYDIEVYPNLFVVCWKYAGSDTVARMINPTAEEIEPLFSMKLVGFNNRRYDNHILYARFLGYSVNELYHLSQKIITTKNNNDVLFGDAYNISYADIYDFSSKKQGLKKFQIELNIFHMELDIPWDQPVPQELWKRVEEYCVNDVISTEKVFEDRKQDFVARQILAELSGLSVNHTTQNHTAKIIFGEDKKPQDKFVYTDLSEMFPGYVYGSGKDPETGNDVFGSFYKGELVGEGGYVHAEPGMYSNVALLDVASMHPTSIIELDLFGPYTGKFKDLLDARLAIKRKDYDAAAKMLGGKLEPFLTRPHEGYDIEAANDLAYALKIVINIVYGLTSASFPNAFRDNRNKDNIVAKRGALFMIDLKQAVQEKGFTVAHIKTDSIKIPDATPDIIEFVVDFGKRYGYDFEHEVTYDRFCLVNDAVYIARAGDKWTAVGAQFQHPYVYKKLFTKEELTFADFCETKNVQQGTMYLDFSDTGEVEKMIHVGRTGSFVPVLEGGGNLWRIKDDKKYAVSGTKGHKWIARDVAADKYENGSLQLDLSYFEELKAKAMEAVMQFDIADEFDFDSFIR